MRFYDTLSREVEKFQPGNPPEVGIYTCGPTVYRYAHLGNLRTYITADLLRRGIENEGYNVRQVTNITDVGHMTDDVREAGDDKMLLAAEDEGLTPEEIAQKYTEAFLQHADALGVKRSEVYPKATDHIEWMIEVIAKLLERGHAYETEGTVYYDVDSFPGYGKLSRNTVEALQEGHRLEAADPNKRHHYDFTLWRAAGDRRLMSWPSPWGEGYPGWHIECSAMSMGYLGESFDIHTGGSDNIFPHHEDEIAQSEGATGRRVVRRWLHGHHLLADGRKMSKSTRNDYTVDDLVQRGHDPLAFRYLVLQTRYRSQENFTWPALEAAQRGLDNLRLQMAEWVGPEPEVLSDAARSMDESFVAAVGDDLDTPQGLVVTSQLISSEITPAEKFHLLKRWDRLLGLDLDRHVVSRSELPPGASEKIEARERARETGDWESADRLRDELAEMGVEVIDTAEGSRWVVTDP